MTVDADWERIGGNEDDVQGRLLTGILSYRADLTQSRYVREVTRASPSRRVFGPLATMETNEVRDQRRKEEQRRIRRENKAMRERLANVRAKVDDDTEDDATGEWRARLRAESAAQRQQAMQALEQKNEQ